MIDPEMECPINFLMISSKQPEYNFTMKSLQLTNGHTLWYSNEAIDKPILVKFIIRQKGVCLRNVETDKDVHLFPLDFHYNSTLNECKYTKNEINHNTNYKLLDSISLYDLYDENNHLQFLNSILFYPTEELKNYNMSLFVRSFVGFDKECLTTNGKTVTSLYDYCQSLFGLDDYLTWVYILLFGALVIAGIKFFFTKQNPSFISALLFFVIGVLFFICFRIVNKEDLNNLCIDNISRLQIDDTMKHKGVAVGLYFFLGIINCIPILFICIYKEIENAKKKSVDDDIKEKEKEINLIGSLY